MTTTAEEKVVQAASAYCQARVARQAGDLYQQDVADAEMSLMLAVAALGSERDGTEGRG